MSRRKIELAAPAPQSQAPAASRKTRGREPQSEPNPQKKPKAPRKSASQKRLNAPKSGRARGWDVGSWERDRSARRPAKPLTKPAEPRWHWPNQRRRSTRRAPGPRGPAGRAHTLCKGRQGRGPPRGAFGGARIERSQQVGTPASRTGHEPNSPHRHAALHGRTSVFVISFLKISKSVLRHVPVNAVTGIRRGGAQIGRFRARAAAARTEVAVWRVSPGPPRRAVAAPIGHSRPSSAIIQMRVYRTFKFTNTALTAVTLTGVTSRGASDVLSF